MNSDKPSDGTHEVLHDRAPALLRENLELKRSLADAEAKLRFFFSQLQMTDAKIHGQHRWRFTPGGWPMTHCIGNSPEDAVAAAMREVNR